MNHTGNSTPTRVKVIRYNFYGWRPLKTILVLAEHTYLAHTWE